MVAFGQQVLAGPGDVTDALHGHGHTDEQIAEVVDLVALQLLTGGSNLVAGHPDGAHLRRDAWTLAAAP